MDSSRSSSPPASQLRVRKRANTKILLGDEYIEVVTEPLNPPHPLPNISDYNENRLKEGLKYADSTLRDPLRKLSPIGMHALKLYKDACARLLDLEDGETFDDKEEFEAVKQEWIANIRTYEQSIQYHACLNITHTSDAQRLQEEILNLQRTTFYARYGDYLAESCRQLKCEAEARKVEGWQRLSKSYWSEVSRNLDEEQNAYEEVLRGKRLHDQCPTYLAISHTCRRVGFNMDDMLSAIRHYAVRNELVHANLTALIKDNKFATLAKRLHDDYCDVPRLTSPLEEMPSALMLQLIEAIINLWFDRDPDYPEDYETWSSNETLRQLRNELRGPCKEADVNKGISHEIQKALRKTLREAEQERGLVDMLNQNFGLLSGGKRVKRVASTKLEAERERTKKMKRDWDKIKGMAAGIRKMSETYILTYGELAAPPEVVLDPSMEA